jgi:hypothetical protein
VRARRAAEFRKWNILKPAAAAYAQMSTIIFSLVRSFFFLTQVCSGESQAEVRIKNKFAAAAELG